ncbi:general odorant-binding protein 69a [Plodia interpunctella]|uniref:general odorant-binding protein 69a n=1 Tax=Plodia interpunctella TaxID=58824 RepID=UPI00236829B7|nr:general odorant-binding protein 69a-like [Plodia interpunctella]
MTRLRVWVVVAALVAAAAGMDEEMAELAKMVHDSCGEETGADLAPVDKVNAGEDLTTFSDPKLKCYIKCIMETAGMMTDGEVDVEAVLAMLPDDIRARNEAAMRGCGTQRGADHCDNAYLTHICWQKANKKDYFLI